MSNTNADGASRAHRQTRERLRQERLWLHELAEQQQATIADKHLWWCWRLVARAVSDGDTLATLRKRLRAGEDTGINELGFTHTAANALKVSLLDEAYACDSQALLAELETLAARHAAAASARSGGGRPDN